VTRLQFISAIKPSCVTAQEAFGIPWGWFVAQAIQESGGYGKSDLSINAHNLYGIKDTGADAYYQGKVGYAKFPTWHDAIQFQGWQLSQSRYLPFKVLAATGKFKEYGDAISKAGWCPQSTPSYGTMIQDIAETYKLLPAPKVVLSEAQQWVIDNKVFNAPVDWEKPVTMNTLAWALYKGRKI
jgi:flagellum-specific peptidoglycan hydrolase FlgJ